MSTMSVRLPNSLHRQLRELAQREGWWLLSDEVYEDFVYCGAHFSLGRLAPERTISFQGSR